MPRILTFIFLVSLLTVLGCDSGGDGGPFIPPDEEIEGRLTAEINGRAYEANASIEATMQGTTLIVTGTDSTARTISLSLRNADRIGTYLIADGQTGDATATYVASGVEYQTLAENAGTLNLTRFDSVAVRGTFRFNAVALSGAQANVDQGEFLAPRVDEQ